MKKFAYEVLRFLEETYQDAYTYQFHYDPCTNWEDCLELHIINKFFDIKINKRKIHELYLMYKSGNDLWKEKLIESVDIL